MEMILEPLLEFRVHRDPNRLVGLPLTFYEDDEGDLDFYEVGMISWLVATNVDDFTLLSMVENDRFKDADRVKQALRTLVRHGFLSYRANRDDDDFKFVVLYDAIFPNRNE